MQSRSSTNNRALMIITVILFLGALYLTELSPFSGNAIAKINGGYGTFDMKKYNVTIYEQVMSVTENFDLYWKYYICDFVFIAAFLNFMVQLVRKFCFRFDTQARVLTYILAGTRAVFDAIENVMLMYLIYAYPHANTDLVQVANMITRIKFLFMQAWILCYIAFTILSIIHKRRSNEKSVDNISQVNL